jgi:hypothetical protein
VLLPVLFAILKVHTILSHPQVDAEVGWNHVLLHRIPVEFLKPILQSLTMFFRMLNVSLGPQETQCLPRNTVTKNK